ncbi:MAG: histidine phosphatase family protein [Anaerolineae bacterium]|nr:histidine phosphatase family protein [Thermoflexales bacterium]MDW8407238.1 histidine phosphatase family protein [Anaerolineae bacterium]
MPVLLLIRHATNDFVKTGRLPGQTPNIHLNEEGRAQADALGQFLKGRKLDAVYASHLERAIETAWRVAAPHGLSIRIRPELADTNTGDLTGRFTKDLLEAPDTKTLWQIVRDKPSEACFPNGECLAAMQHRVVDALEQIAAAHPDPAPPAAPETQSETAIPSTVAVVTHADPIRAALAYFLGMPFDNFQRLGISPASISAVALGVDHATGNRFVHVVNVNQTLPDSTR